MGAIFVPSEMRLYSGGVEREAKCFSLSDSVAKVLSTDKSATDLSECCTITHINSESDLLPICFQDNFPLRLHQSVRRVWMWRCGLLSILSVAIGNHHEVNFSVRFDSNIPRQVGMAGSSAIIVAALRCLMEFYGVQIPLDVQPSLVLTVEVEELGRPAGLQDRVIQVYESLMFMDFAQDQMRKLQGFSVGAYTRLDAELLPPLFIAFSDHVIKPIVSA